MEDRLEIYRRKSQTVGQNFQIKALVPLLFVEKRWNLQQIYDRLRGDLRESMGRSRQASTGILDSQSVKITEKGGFEDTMQKRK